ncbi:MAG: 3'(2'),5'-bisphosphate nucleotidase CysQ [Spirochaetota bacterium]
MSIISGEIAERIRSIADTAGESIMKVYESADFGIETKSDDSPLTRADCASHDVIVEGLASLPEEYRFPLLSEEGRGIPYEERVFWKNYYLIDPLDGTKEFIRQNGEFTVNIALVRDGVPVFGVVYAPAKDLCYYGGEGFGAWKRSMGTTVPVSAEAVHPERLTVVASRSHLSPETEQYIESLRNRFDRIETVSSGSSLKFCMVADGSADVYPRLAPTMEWDTAAADAVCRTAGCSVVEYENGEVLRYNKENLLNPWFIVKGKRL